MRKLLVLLLIAVVFTACNQSGEQSNKKEFAINGKITGITSGLIKLNKMEGRDLIAIDSVNSTDGSFNFKGSVDVPEVYFISVAEKEGNIRFFVENSNITINAGIDSLDKAQIVGSNTQETFNSFKQNYSVYENKQKDLYNQYTEAESKGDKVLTAKIDSTYEALEKEKSEFLKKYVSENTKSVVSAYVTIKILFYNLELPELEKITNSFDSTIYASSYVKELKNRVETLKKVEVGQPAPDFTMVDTTGKEISLSSLKGRFVLVDFWASWCRPCRAENPNNVEMYKKYKSKGFEILGVSLDDNKEDWTAAIKKDKLTWLHVSHLKGWDCATAKMYGVFSIPHTVLLDKNGVIIAKNLRGEELKKKLAEVIK